MTAILLIFLPRDCAIPQIWKTTFPKAKGQTIEIFTSGRFYSQNSRSIFPRVKICSFMLISWNRCNNYDFFSQRRAITSVTITKNNGEKLHAKVVRVYAKNWVWVPRIPPSVTLVNECEFDIVKCSLQTIGTMNEHQLSRILSVFLVL